jgi:hypothetical protein
MNSENAVPTKTKINNVSLLSNFLLLSEKATTDELLPFFFQILRYSPTR